MPESRGWRCSRFPYFGIYISLVKFLSALPFYFAKGKKEQTINFNGDLCTNIEADNIQKLN